MQSRTYLIVATVLMSVIFIAANLLAQTVLTGAQADFTENRLFSLSKATKDTLTDIAEPVDITFVYSRSVGQDFPAVRSYAARVRELLQAYAAQSRGNVRIREIDPSPFSPAEDEALASGITAIGTNGNDPLYFGIIGRNTIDDERIIPFLAPEREITLEYDLTRMIARLDDPDPPRVGILTSLPGMAAPGGQGGYTLLQDIARSFEIVPVPEDFQSLPADLDVLLVAHPPALSRRQEWLLDQFVLRTGRAVFLVDPAAKTALAQGPFDISTAEAHSDLGMLGAAWGVTLAPDAVADAAGALMVPVDLGDGRTEEQAHPLFIGAPAIDMNQEDLITADLSRTVNFGAPGAFLSASLADGLSFSPLIETGPSPSFIDANKAVRDMKPSETLKSYETQPGPLVIAGRLSGQMQTAFPAGAPAFEEPADPVLAELARAEAANAPPHISSSEINAEIVLVADVDFISDDFYIIPGRDVVVADNGALVLNALDALAGGGELSRLRSRAPSLRPMKRIDDMRAQAEARYFRQQAELEAGLQDAQGRLEELQAIGSTDGFYAGDAEADLTDEERAELAQLRERIVSLRGQLRDIERDYRRNIDRLEGILKAINIWGGPLLVALAGLFVWRRQRTHARRDA
ncbi:MAG: GldG family protein [Hyphomonas sp.]|uniref:Gldg family protein n=1 Tax=Hyphomonas sp. TaxID=87 RepID=UPI003527AD03